jgi:hypothetical protein
VIPAPGHSESGTVGHAEKQKIIASRLKPVLGMPKGTCIPSFEAPRDVEGYDFANDDARCMGKARRQSRVVLRLDPLSAAHLCVHSFSYTNHMCVTMKQDHILVLHLVYALVFIYISASCLHMHFRAFPSPPTLVMLSDSRSFTSYVYCIIYLFTSTPALTVV